MRKSPDDAEVEQMTALDMARTNAAKEFGRWLASPKGIRAATTGNLKMAAVVVCDSEESVGDVFKRFSDYAPPLTVAVWFASRDEFVIMGAEPAQSNARSKSRDGVDPQSTIGMLADYTARNGSFNFQLTKWESKVEIRIPHLV